jgi:hypothetical protein
MDHGNKTHTSTKFVDTEGRCDIFVVAEYSQYSVEVLIEVVGQDHCARQKDSSACVVSPYRKGLLDHPDCRDNR